MAVAADGRKCIMKPIISKAYCWTSDEAVFAVRSRPHVVNGGGFVVTDCSQKHAFRVDGCGIVGRKGELILRDGDGNPLLLIRQKGGVLQALSINKQWKGYALDYEGAQNLVFCVREPNSSFLSCTNSNNNAIRVSTNPTGGCTRDWDYEVKGSFSERNCNILDSLGNIAAQIGTRRGDVEKAITSKDVYPVTVTRGTDQAFVFGVIAVLDYIHHESTRC